MCKVLMLVGISPDKSNAAANFIRKSAKYMSENDSDGAGYLATDGKSLFGEKWLRNSDAFKTTRKEGKDQDKINSIFEHAVPNSFSRYDYFGDKKVKLENATSILFHTRMATCDKAIYNTHPFVIGDTGLIHNGVILNSDFLLEDEETVSTCDSEAILHQYLNNRVNIDPSNIQDVADALEGWYVAGLISKDETGRSVVDIFKCNRSSLCVGWIPELATFALCTEIGILKKSASAAGMTVSAYDFVSGGVFLRFDAITGERLCLLDFEPSYKKPFSSREEKIWEDVEANIFKETTCVKKTG
jgi:hypothetical protein